jgi:hypothetical protein
VLPKGIGMGAGSVAYVFFKRGKGLEDPWIIHTIKFGRYRICRKTLSSVALRNITFEEKGFHFKINTVIQFFLSNLALGVTATARRHPPGVATEEQELDARWLPSSNELQPPGMHHLVERSH